MIKLQKYELKNIEINNLNDKNFFEKMNQDEEFKKFFGGIVLSSENKDSIFMNDYLVQFNRTIVGYIHIADKINNGEIVAVTLYYYIDKLYRGNGIATTLLKELMEYLSKEENINYFILNINKANIPSIYVALNNEFIQKREIEEDEEEIQFVHKTL